MRAEPESAADGRAPGRVRHGEAGVSGSGIQKGLNPYAPPKANVELAPQAGTLWRSGKLVRMDRDSTLPDRCIACNAPAESYRISRKLYYSPLAWRIGAFVAPFAALFAGLALNVDFLMVSFWPLVLLLVVVNLFVRKALKLELGLCPRHRRQRHLLTALSLLGVIGVAAGVVTIFEPLGVATLLVSTVAVLALAVTQVFLGASAVRLKELDAQHAWLSGTSAAFRRELPELN